MRLDRVAQQVDVIAIVAVAVLLLVAYALSRIWALAQG
jgi:hypothetical protein